MRVFLVNVGVNTTDDRRYGLRSPRFPDMTFEFIPIKEPSSLAYTPGIPRFHDLRSWNSPELTLAAFVPERLHRYAVHTDPDFEGFTYGDIATPRAARLAEAEQGDELWFLARLWDHDGGQWTGQNSFNIIGYFCIQQNILLSAESDVLQLPAEPRARIEQNAHYKRMKLRADKGPFRVIIGTRERSLRFRYALEVTLEVAGHIYGGTWDPTSGVYRSPNGQILLNRNGRPRSFETFGSTTRTIQAFLDSGVREHRPHIGALHELATHHRGRMD